MIATVQSVSRKRFGLNPFASDVSTGPDPLTKYRRGINSLGTVFDNVRLASNRQWHAFGVNPRFWLCPTHLARRFDLNGDFYPNSDHSAFSSSVSGTTPDGMLLILNKVSRY